jgi:hypothetical protein
MDRVRVAVVLSVLVLTTGCTGGGSTPRGTPPSRTALPADFADCPPVGHTESHAAIDYVDFLQAFGEQYVAGLAARPLRVRRAQLGGVVLRSRCSLSKLNDRTQQVPGPSRDGDTAFLAPGTPIYAVKGWSTRCRLAAPSAAAGRLVAYLAVQPNARHASPRRCARRR